MSTPYVNLMPGLPDWKSATVLPALMAILMVLSACSSKPTMPALSAKLYQPTILNLPAGLPVQTSQGIHTPTVPETWHSQRSIDDLEALLIRERRANRNTGYVPLPPVPSKASAALYPDGKPIPPPPPDPTLGERYTEAEGAAAARKFFQSNH
jgi:hypothetical protein